MVTSLEYEGTEDVFFIWDVCLILKRLFNFETFVYFETSLQLIWRAQLQV
jgi:hypothetical protein